MSSPQDSPSQPTTTTTVTMTDVLSPPPMSNVPSPDALTSQTHSQLASILADACKEAEHLRRELSSTRKRAEKAERLVAALSAVSGQGSNSPTASSSPNVTPSAAVHNPDAARALILEYEERVAKAEQARDEAEARRRMVVDNWQQLERYLQGLEFHASDARAGFARIVADGGGPLVLADLNALPAASRSLFSSSSTMGPPSTKGPHRNNSTGSTASTSNRTTHYPLSSLPLPPHPAPGSRVRNRDSSMDEASQPPPKKPRIVYAEPSNSPHLSNAQYAQQQSYGTPTLHAISRKDEMHVQYVDQHGQPIAPSNHEYPSPYPPPHTIQSHRSSRHATQPVYHHPQARLINDKYGASPNLHHPRSRSRSRSHSRSSSAESENIDELLLAATGDENQPQFPHGNPNHPNPPHQQPRSNGQVVNGIHHHGHHPATHSPNAPPYQPHHPSRPYSPSSKWRQPPPPSNVAMPSRRYSPPPQPIPPSMEYRATRSGRQSQVEPGPLPQPGQVQTYQTHVFAPVVTGAPVKKSKFGASGSSGNLTANGSQSQGDVNGVQSAPPPPSFPPTNAQGQRICRQCGLPGRYKEGKCVEKWGPGPQGPGTVCDRCRKKMKRVERRGTLEGQQLAAQTANAVAAAHNAAFQQQTAPVRTIQAPPRTDTMPIQQYKDDSSANLRSAITNSHRGRAPPSPPSIATLPEGTLSSHSRSNSRNGSRRPPKAGSSSPLVGEGGARKVGRMSKMDIDGGDPEPDADADGSGDGDGDGPEEDGDALRELAEIAGVADDIGSKEAEAGEEGVDADAEAEAEDAEADLLEAVDAAEANSSNSSAGGSWMKSESI
ncbi:hypothetical protein PC9H_005827 [Pleurotus ostreatus]|uniref:Uncharacterized protein n=1 Tax=Pleurotus ostreatus TaxID=5322 RepID=A0A8H7A095_PLEOS|nr:uncharacterized protein PC9H_005827 [Pleurotus ostreatus]KAF7433861.1 hypothetical protein PC9H_005827 [Pleurotus ostreatus]